MYSPAGGLKNANQQRLSTINTGKCRSKLSHSVGGWFRRIFGVRAGLGVRNDGIDKLPKLVSKEKHSVLPTAHDHLRDPPEPEKQHPEDAPGYTGKKLTICQFVSSLFTLYKEKNALHVLRPFQTYRTFEVGRQSIESLWVFKIRRHTSSSNRSM